MVCGLTRLDSLVSVENLREKAYMYMYQHVV